MGLWREKLRNPDTALVFLPAIVGQEVGRNHLLFSIHHPGGEEEQTMFFLECSAKVCYRLYYENRRGFETHNASHLNCELAHTERFCF